MGILMSIKNSVFMSKLEEMLTDFVPQNVFGTGCVILYVSAVRRVLPVSNMSTEEVSYSVTVHTFSDVSQQQCLWNSCSPYTCGGRQIPRA